ncbi:hypothetical protein ACFL41_01235 [Gemmatimonadota bacterium]
MRTTIEMDPEHRARLLEIAARRGEKGFSGVVAEAIESYLIDQDDLIERQRKALQLRGKLSEEDAADLAETIKEIRTSWR